MKKRILFILKLSKKNETGFYLMNSYVLNSKKLKSNYNAQFIALHSATFANKLLYYFATIFNLIKHAVFLVYKIRTFKPELVYFTISPVNSFLRDIIYVSIIKMFRVKLIYHLHGKGIKEKYQQSKLHSVLYKWAFKNENVICLSEKLSFDFDFLPINKYYVVPNAIKDLEIKKTKIKKTHSINLLFLSNLIYSKGIVDFIEAVKILLKEQLNVEAQIVGKEFELNIDALNSLIAPFNDKIKYMGPKYDNDKTNILFETDIFIFPTTKDVWGLVILEAMQAQLPVITTNEGAITDMIENNKNGFIVEKNNPYQIAEKAKTLIQDKNLRIRMGKSNRQKFLNYFTIDIFEEKLNQVLQEY